VAQPAHADGEIFQGRFHAMAGIGLADHAAGAGEVFREALDIGGHEQGDRAAVVVNLAGHIDARRPIAQVNVDQGEVGLQVVGEGDGLVGTHGVSQRVQARLFQQELQLDGEKHLVLDNQNTERLLVHNPSSPENVRNARR
jgi:hypothetical protein